MKKQKEIRVYVKRDKRYWRGDHYFTRVGYVLLLAFLWAMIMAWTNRHPLVSPIVVGPVHQVSASEPIKISCETPKGYLECKVYKGEITWEQHDRMYKIIQCESKWNPDAVNIKNKNGTWDRGLVQINSIHKDISNADAFNFKKAIDWMIKKVNKDGGYGAWVCAR